MTVKVKHPNSKFHGDFLVFSELSTGPQRSSSFSNSLQALGIILNTLRQDPSHHAVESVDDFTLKNQLPKVAQTTLKHSLQCG